MGARHIKIISLFALVFVVEFIIYREMTRMCCPFATQTRPFLSNPDAIIRMMIITTVALGQLALLGYLLRKRKM